MIDKIKPQTMAAWDISLAGKDQAGAIALKIVELTNVMQAKGASQEAFNVYITDDLFFKLRPKLAPCVEAAGEMTVDKTKWVFHRDKSDSPKLLIRGGGHAALMMVSGL